VATDADISRFGPLDGSPSLTNSVWTGATLGSQTALVNTTYPSIRGGGVMPNHPMHVHTDNKLYVGDFSAGVGYIHFIKTTEVTDEGDTNDGSTYNALDLPFGYMPVDIESYGNDLVIAAIQTSDSTIGQGKAALFFWDTTSDSFYNQVALPDPLVTALLNNNGQLYIFSGAVSTGSSISRGYRVSRFLGGQTIETLYLSDVGSPPLAGAVDASGDRIVWGTFTQIPDSGAGGPEFYAVAMAMGSNSPQIPFGVHCIANATATGALGDGIVTSLKFAEQAPFSNPKLIMGHRDAGGPGIDKQSTTYTTNVFRSQMFNIGRKFTIKSLRMTLPVAVATNMTITPKVFLDDFSSDSTSGLTVVNDTNYADSERSVQMYPSISGDHNFVLELRWTGSVLAPVLLPVIIEFEVEDD